MATSSLGRQNTPTINLAGGVRFDLDPLELKPTESSYSRNWVMRIGKLRLREATRTFASFDGTVTPLTAMFNGAYSFEFDEGTRYIVAINFDGVAGWIWTYTGSTWTEISSGTVITVGGDSYPWNIAFGVDTAMGANGTVFFVNGANEIAYWDKSTCGLLSASGGYNGPGGPYMPKYCCIFEGSLIIANLVENSNTHIYRMRASAINSFNVFDTTLGAQVVDHADSPGAITGLRVMGNRLLVLKEDQIIVGQHTQDATTPIVYPLRINTGCLVGSSFQDIAPGIGIFLGPENVYLFTDGTTKPIGDAIRSDLFERLDYNRLVNVCSHVYREKGIYRLFIPSSTTTGTLAYCYNFVDNVWFTEEWPGGVFATTDSNGVGGTLISSLGSAISTYTIPISSWGGSLGRILPVFSSSTSSTDFRLMELDNFSEDEFNEYTAIVPEWWSKDVEFNPEGFSTLAAVHLTYRSATDTLTTIGVSTDRGATWTDQTISLAATGGSGTAWSRGHFSFRITGRYHRIRLIAVAPMGTAGSTTMPIEVAAMNLSYLSRRTER